MKQSELADSIQNQFNNQPTTDHSYTKHDGTSDPHCIWT